MKINDERISLETNTNKGRLNLKDSPIKKQQLRQEKHHREEQFSGEGQRRTEAAHTKNSSRPNGHLYSFNMNLRKRSYYQRPNTKPAEIRSHSSTPA